MSTDMGPIFKTTLLRQAEHADARLEIRREDKQNDGKKQEFEQQDETTNDLWEDSNSVSVEALRTFLIEFLKSRGDPVPEATSPDSAELSLMAQLGPEERTPATPIAARAVKAYAAMAVHSSAYVPPPPRAVVEPPASSNEQVDLVSLLKADEIRTMHVLITELEILARKGVQTLTILKAETFLQSVVEAVRLEKQRV